MNFLSIPSDQQGLVTLTPQQIQQLAAQGVIIQTASPSPYTNQFAEAASIEVGVSRKC